MLQINISTQPARLEYNIKNAQLNLQSKRPVLQMETAPATLETHQPRGELSIDMTPCRYSIGLKNNADFARDNAELGRQTAREAVARIVQEGDRLAHIESKADALADIAADACYTEVPEVTLAHIDLPNIQYQANAVQFNPIAGKVNYTVQPGTVQADYQPGSVDVQVVQYPSVQFSTVDVKV